MNFIAELKRRNVIRMAGLYLVGAWLMVQVAETLLPIFHTPDWVLQALVVVVALGFVPVLVFSWVFELTPDGLKRDADVLPTQSIAPQTARRMNHLIVAGLVLVIVLLVVERMSGPLSDAAVPANAKSAASESGPDTLSQPPVKRDKSIAVLAFSNLSEDAANEYFADGISEELLNVLAKVPSLKVAARTSAFHFKGKDTPIPEIARQLGVAYVVEGSVRRAGDSVRITAQLISAADGFHVWSESYDRELTDVFALQDEIAGIIAAKLKLSLGESARAATRVNPEAHRQLLEGRHFLLRRTEQGFDRADAAYSRSLALDPEFAQAHAAMAELWMIRGWYRLLESRPGANDDFARARTHAQRAMTLDPELAEPHGALGGALYMQYRFDEAEEEFKRALALNPNYAIAHNWYGLLLSSRGDPEGAVEALARATALDPLSAIALNTYSALLHDIGRDDEALAAIERGKAVRSELFVPDYSRSTLINLALSKNDAAVADARLIARARERAPRWAADGEAVYVLEQAGLHAEAQAHANWALTHWPKTSHQQGHVFAALGRHAEAWSTLRAAPPSVSRAFYYSRLWDPVRDDPGFADLIENLGLTQEYALARANVAKARAKSKARRDTGAPK